MAWAISRGGVVSWGWAGGRVAKREHVEDREGTVARGFSADRTALCAWRGRRYRGAHRQGRAGLARTPPDQALSQARRDKLVPVIQGVRRGGAHRVQARD